MIFFFVVMGVIFTSILLGAALLLLIDFVASPADQWIRTNIYGMGVRPPMRRFEGDSQP